MKRWSGKYLKKKQVCEAHSEYFGVLLGTVSMAFGVLILFGWISGVVGLILEISWYRKAMGTVCIKISLK